MRKAVAQIEPPGTKYGDLPVGAIYKVPGDEKEEGWIKAMPDEAGDFKIQNNLLAVQYNSNRPKKSKYVEFFGVLTFTMEV